MSDAPLREGLDGLLAGATGRGYLEGLVGTSTLSGPFATARAGFRLLPNVGTYAEATVAGGVSSVGAGVRWVF